MSSPQLVVAAVIEREGRVLICQRAPDQPHALKWEFPGGKVKPGEDPVAALQRELQEELGVSVAVQQELARYNCQYPGQQPILLVFFRARLLCGEPENRAFAQIRWETPERLEDYDWLECDRQALKRLARQIQPGHPAIAGARPRPASAGDPER